MRVRPARPQDVPEVLALIQALAEYERAADQVETTEADLVAALFGPSPAVYAHLAEADDQVVGLAVWFVTFSTWTGRHGIWLEDLFVLPDARGRGAGLALLATLAAHARDRGYRRLEWSVLDWNTPARDFYRSWGATPMEEWTVHRLHGEALHALADRAGT